MITFILGVSATVLVGMLVWFTIDTVKQLKRIKQLETEKDALWKEIIDRCDRIEIILNREIARVDRRVDDNSSYTDSRFDKFANVIERDYVSKTERASNTISYNN